MLLVFLSINPRRGVSVDLLTLMILSGNGLGGQSQAMNMMFMQNINQLDSRLTTQAAEIAALRSDVTTLNESVNDMAQAVNSAACAVTQAFGMGCTSSTIPATAVRVI